MLDSQLKPIGRHMMIRECSSRSTPMIDTLEARTLLSIAEPASDTGAAATTPPGSIVVPPIAAPVGVGVTIRAAVGQSFSGDVGTIKGLKVTAADLTKYLVTINWGDATGTSSGTLTVDATGLVHVQGTHTYAKAGVFGILVTVTQKPTSTPVTTSTTPTPISPTPAPFKLVILSTAIVEASMIVIRPVAGTPFTGVVGKFTMPPIATPAAGSTTTSPVLIAPAASIDWGDGSTSIGKIVPDATASLIGYSVIGTHTYAKAGQYKIHILVTLGPTPGPGPQPSSAVVPPVTFPTRIIADIWSLADVAAATPVTTV